MISLPRASRRRKLCILAFLVYSAISITEEWAPFSSFAMFSNKSIVRETISFRVDGVPADVYDFTDFTMSVPAFSIEWENSLMTQGGDGNTGLGEIDAYVRQHKAKGSAPGNPVMTEVLLHTTSWDEKANHPVISSRSLCRGLARKKS